jgi:hypothetical protein
LGPTAHPWWGDAAPTTRPMTKPIRATPRNTRPRIQPRSDLPPATCMGAVMAVTVTYDGWVRKSTVVRAPFFSGDTCTWRLTSFGAFRGRSTRWQREKTVCRKIHRAKIEMVNLGSRCIHCNIYGTWARHAGLGQTSSAAGWPLGGCIRMCGERAEDAHCMGVFHGQHWCRLKGSAAVALERGSAAPEYDPTTKRGTT